LDDGPGPADLEELGGGLDSGGAAGADGDVLEGGDDVAGLLAEAADDALDGLVVDVDDLDEAAAVLVVGVEGGDGEGSKEAGEGADEAAADHGLGRLAFRDEVAPPDLVHCGGEVHEEGQGREAQGDGQCEAFGDVHAALFGGGFATAVEAVH